MFKFFHMIARIYFGRFRNHTHDLCEPNIDKQETNRKFILLPLNCGYFGNGWGKSLETIKLVQTNLATIFHKINQKNRAVMGLY